MAKLMRLQLMRPGSKLAKVRPQQNRTRQVVNEFLRHSFFVTNFRNNVEDTAEDSDEGWFRSELVRSSAADFKLRSMIGGVVA